MRISDWSSDVCSSDLHHHAVGREGFGRVRRDGDRIAHVVEAVEEADEVVALAGVVVGACRLEGGASRDARRLGDLVRLGDRVEMRVEADAGRSDEIRVWTVCVSMCRSRWAPLFAKNIPKTRK